MSEQEDQGASGKGAVFDFDAAKKKQKGRSQKETTADKEFLHHEYMCALSGRPVLWPQLGRKFAIICDPAGVRTFVEIDAREVVTHVPHTTVRDALLKYNCDVVQPVSLATPLLKVTEALEIATRWAARQVPIDEHQIAGVRELSEKGLCWQRLEFDLADGASATFDELFSRMDTNAQAVRAWIGSLFDEKSSRQQYVWLHGAGRNGKSSLLGFLKKVFGPTYKAAYMPKKGVNNFWTRSLLGKRVVAFTDCSNFNFVTDDMFKSLTGGDAVETELKGGAIQTSDMICKIIFASNEKPKLTGAEADTRRAIYAELRPVEGELLGKEEYEGRLWAEAAAFLWKCRQAYVPWAKAAEIPIDREALEELVRSSEEKWYAVCERYLVFGPGQSMPPMDMLDLCRGLGKFSDADTGKFKTYLERQHAVKKTRCPVGEDGKRPWKYLGVALNKEAEREIRSGRESVF